MRFEAIKTNKSKKNVSIKPKENDVLKSNPKHTKKGAN